MRKKLTAAWIVVVLSTACGRSALQRDQKQYETVEEGSASGVTSTIQGPGETLPPITDTNADGTSAFTLDPNAGTAAPSYPETTTVATAPLPERRIPDPRRPVNPTPMPEPTPEPTPAQTETTATQAPEPKPPAENTDTATTPQPPEKGDAPETTTSTEEPPPPPPFAV
jgi:hypothetical protein